MQRRNFFKLAGMGMLSLPLMKNRLFCTEADGRHEGSPWNHGSPYLGHADRRSHFRGLTAEQIRQEMAHFRTAEPWRKKIIFGL